MQMADRRLRAEVRIGIVLVFIRGRGVTQRVQVPGVSGRKRVVRGILDLPVRHDIGHGAVEDIWRLLEQQINVVAMTLKPAGKRRGRGCQCSKTEHARRQCFSYHKIPPAILATAPPLTRRGGREYREVQDSWQITESADMTRVLFAELRKFFLNYAKTPSI